MGILSIIIIIVWASLIFNGIYGLVKGYFYREQDKIKGHEPKACRKWIKLSSVFLILCGAINVVWSIFDAFSEATDFKYLFLILITAAITIAAIAIAYCCIVKPADERAKKKTK